MLWLSLFVVLTLGTAVVRLAWRVKTTDERTARMEARLAAVLEGPDAGLAVWDRSGRLVACTQRFREFYPTIQLKPGLVFEDLIRYTATRGLIQIDQDRVEAWIDERIGEFGQTWHEVVRTPDRRWIEIDTRPTRAGEVVLSFSDATRAWENEATSSHRGERLDQQTRNLNLLTAAIGVGSTARSPEAAVAEVVALVTAWGGWPVGYAYRVVGSGDTVTVEPMAAWHLAADLGETGVALREAIERNPSPSEDGVALRACRTGRIVWIPNIGVDPSIGSGLRTAMTDFRGACAVPVTRDGQTVAVLVFLSRDQLMPEPTATQLLEVISETLGWLYRRSSGG
jgi:hypothetical protein